MKEFGRLDFAVNNEGISPLTGNTVECTFETWQRVIDVNLTGTWLGMKYQIPAMVTSARPLGYGTGDGRARQMSAAYSAIVRSLEKRPEQAMLMIAFSAHA